MVFCVQHAQRGVQDASVVLMRQDFFRLAERNPLDFGNLALTRVNFGLPGFREEIHDLFFDPRHGAIVDGSSESALGGEMNPH